MRKVLIFWGSAIILAVLAINAAAQTRSITVVTEPKSRVWIDGILFGRTGADGRLEIRSIAAGAHQLKIRSDGSKEKVQILPAAAKGDIAVTLAKTDDPAELAFQDAERLGSLDREKQIAAYKKAIKLRPAYFDAYIGLARAQTEDGDTEAAQQTISKLKRLRPGIAEASAVEGRIWKESGDETKAIATFKRSIAEGKGIQAEANTGLGLLYKDRAESAAGSGDTDNEKANYTEAAKYLKIALKQLSGAPDALVIYQLLGLVYERMDQKAEAIAVYNEFLKLFPDAPEASAVRSFIVQLEKGPTIP